jgi:hypothetical protein
VALDHSSQSRRASYDERGHDLYETPDVATQALLRAYPQLPMKLWEFAAGRNAMVDVLRASGRQVLATDLIDYGIENPSCYGRDFLKETHWPSGYGGCTNPPFREDLPQRFVEHALRLGAPLICMLLRTAFLESAKRAPILENRGLEWILQFRKRLPMMHRDNWQGPKANSGMSFCWMIWRPGYRGLPRVHRISWEPDQPCDPVPELMQRIDRTGAWRQARWRERQRAGTMVLRLRANRSRVAWLVEHEWLRQEDIDNPALVADAIDRMLTDTETTA